MKIKMKVGDRQLYEKVRRLAGKHYFSIERTIDRHAHGGKISPPEISVKVFVFEHGSIRFHERAADNDGVWALLKMAKRKEKIKASRKARFKESV